jgi:hypothetical protein
MSKIRDLIMWHLFVLLLCFPQVRSDWKVDLASWKDVPGTIAGFKPRSNLTMNFESDWMLDFVLPKPDTSGGPKDEGSQRSKKPETVAFHVEQNKVQSSSPACSSILHEIGNLIPIALENVMNGLYRPINPMKKYEGLFLVGYIYSKAKQYSSRFTDINPSTTTSGGAARTDYINYFLPPNVDSISIIIKDYNFTQTDFSVSTLEPFNSEDPSKRTLYLSLGWLRQSWENPLPWQTPAVRRLVLLELLTHELAHVYQYTRPDYLNVKKKQNQPPPRALIEGISKFVTLQADLAWQGVKTPELLGNLPAKWDLNSEHTAYFLLWIENVKNGRGSIASLNDRISKEYYWGLERTWLKEHKGSGDEFWRGLFGASADELWGEYTQYVDKEGYLSPLKWASYSIKSITTSPQNTVKWLKRIFFTIWRKFSYWKRFSFTVFHCLLRGSSRYVVVLITPVLFATITLPIYKLAYDRIRRSRPSIGTPISVFSDGLSLLISGLSRGWHGVKLLASGMWVCISGFLFLYWHALAVLFRIERRLYTFVSWGFDAVPLWFGKALISFVRILLSWVWLWVLTSLVIVNMLLRIPLSLIKFVVVWIISILFGTIAWLAPPWSSANSELPSPVFSPGPSPGSSLDSTPPPSPPNLSYPPSPSSSMPTPTIPRDRQIRSPSPPSSPSSTPSPVTTFAPSPHPGPSLSPPTYYPDSPIPSTETPAWENTSYRSPYPPKETIIKEEEIQVQFEEKVQEEEEEEEEYRIEEILRSRKYGKKLKYRVKWYGKPADQKWYDAAELRYQPHMLEDFHAAHPDQVGPPVRLLDWLHAAENDLEPRRHPDDNVARI